jgi:hypothetical protein
MSELGKGFGGGFEHPQEPEGSDIPEPIQALPDEVRTWVYELHSSLGEEPDMQLDFLAALNSALTVGERLNVEPSEELVAAVFTRITHPGFHAQWMSEQTVQDFLIVDEAKTEETMARMQQEFEAFLEGIITDLE